MGAPLPKPVFVSTDAAEAEAELKGYYEGLIAPRKLRPAQVEMLHVKFGAYVLNLARIGIQLAAEQLLLAYAKYPIIDYLGQYVGVERKEAEPARTTIRFTLTEAQPTDLLIPAGARVRTFDGRMVFATEEDATVPAGEEVLDVTAAAKTAGEAGNDYEAGDVADLLDLNPAIASAVNVTVSAGGAGREDDERVRDQIRRAPDGFSTAGPKPAYEFFARRSHPDIVDAAVLSEEDGLAPGLVRVYPLTADGLPTPEILALVEAAVSDEKVAPTCDRIAVLAPPEVSYALTIHLTLYKDADAATTEAAAVEAAEAYAADRRAGLGRDVVREQIAARCMVPGAYKPEVVSPPDDIVLSREQWANASAVSVVVVGNANG